MNYTRLAFDLAIDAPARLAGWLAGEAWALFVILGAIGAGIWLYERLAGRFPRPAAIVVSFVAGLYCALVLWRAGFHFARILLAD